MAALLLPRPSLGKERQSLLSLVFLLSFQALFSLLPLVASGIEGDRSLSSSSSSFYPERTIPLYGPRLGNLSLNISESFLSLSLPPSAQQFFDQGLNFLVVEDYGRAFLSFKQATEEGEMVDEGDKQKGRTRECALCYWGQALSLLRKARDSWQKVSYLRTWRAAQTAVTLLHQQQQEREKPGEKRESASVSFSLLLELASALADSLPPTLGEYLRERESLSTSAAERLWNLTRAGEGDRSASLLWLTAEAQLYATADRSSFYKEGKREANNSSSLSLSPAGERFQQVLKRALELEPTHLGAQTLSFVLWEAGADRSLCGSSSPPLWLKGESEEEGDGEGDNSSSRLSLLLALRAHHACGRVGEALKLSRSLLRTGNSLPLPLPLLFLRSYLYNLRLAGDPLAGTVAMQLITHCLPIATEREGEWQVELFLSEGFLTYHLYGKYQELSDPGLLLSWGADDFPFLNSVLRFGRGMAAVYWKRYEDAERELEEMSLSLSFLSSSPSRQAIYQPFPAAEVLNILSQQLSATIVMGKAPPAPSAQPNYEPALTLLHNVRERAKSLPFRASPLLWFPFDNVYGAALVQAKKFEKAKKVYEERLSLSPADGWALYGLFTVKKALREEDADEWKARFSLLWRGDTEPSDSSVLKRYGSRGSGGERGTAPDPQAVFVAVTAACFAAAAIGYNLFRFRQETMQRRERERGGERRQPVPVAAEERNGEEERREQQGRGGIHRTLYERVGLIDSTRA